MSVRITKTIPSHPTGPTRNLEQTTTSKRSNALAGFTLIEILIVLAIIALVMSVGLPAISRVTYQQVNATTRKVVGMARTVRNDSILLNVVHRIVFDLDKRQWWVEEQKSFKLLTQHDETAPKPKKKGDPAEPAPSNFSIAEKFSKKPVDLPGGVKISGVRKERGGFSNEGLVYIHFFPNGFNEQAIVYLAKEGNDAIAYSVVIYPTNGRVEVVNAEVKEFAL